MSLYFTTESGITIPTIDSSSYHELLTRMVKEYEFSSTHLSEATSLSMAMVVRYSLGYDANKGSVISIISDSLTGYVATATLRHLVNGGAKGKLVLADSNKKLSPELSKEITLAQNTGVQIITPKEAISQISEFHCAMIGIFGGECLANPYFDNLVEEFNDKTIPVHSIVFPTEDAIANQPKIYSASTLSLGIPLSETIKYYDFIGRHYLCDISIPQTIYQELGLKNCSLFSEQPVIKLLPQKMK